MYLSTRGIEVQKYNNNKEKFQRVTKDRSVDAMNRDKYYYCSHAYATPGQALFSPPL